MDATITLEDIAHGLVVFFGCVSCFFGWRFFRYALTCYSFVGGTALVASLTYFLGLHWIIILVAALLSGLLLAWVSHHLFRLALFLNGFVLGFLASLPLAYSFLPAYAYLLAGLGGLMLGLICFLAHKTVMIVIMSFIGAFFVVYGAAFFVGYSYLSNLLDADSLEAFTMAFDTLGEHPLLLLAVGCLSSFGCAVQRSTESPIREV